ncbi:Hypothetical_protein [Hexamita inflata]|uniref:Hypothetical_protein n=1 Tax=Hexamita inflata TaxID=28002 RepID=A0AA86NCJ9_9EUKA|nr:Hypothetical protein HINF_LOCUS4917 [Hexamita inflata]
MASYYLNYHRNLQTAIQQFFEGNMSDTVEQFMHGTNTTKDEAELYLTQHNAYMRNQSVQTAIQNYLRLRPRRRIQQPQLNLQQQRYNQVFQPIQPQFVSLDQQCVNQQIQNDQIYNQQYSAPPQCASPNYEPASSQFNTYQQQFAPQYDNQYY